MCSTRMGTKAWIGTALNWAAARGPSQRSDRGDSDCPSPGGSPTPCTGTVRLPRTALRVPAGSPASSRPPGASSGGGVRRARHHRVDAGPSSRSFALSSSLASSRTKPVAATPRQSDPTRRTPAAQAIRADGPPWRRRAAAAPYVTPSSIGTITRIPVRPRPSTNATSPRGLPRWMPSTSGPAGVDPGELECRHEDGGGQQHRPAAPHRQTGDAADHQTDSDRRERLHRRDRPPRHPPAGQQSTEDGERGGRAHAEEPVPQRRRPAAVRCPAGKFRRCPGASGGKDGAHASRRTRTRAARTSVTAA